MRRFIRKNVQFPLHIGVFGLHPNAGTTTISILTASYLKFICGMETLVLEQSQKHDLCCLSKEGLDTRESVFMYHNLSFDVSQKRGGKREALRTDYCCYVHDLGCNDTKFMEYANVCNLILCPYRLTSWLYSIKQLKNKKENMRVQTEKIYFLGNMLAKEEQKEAGKAIGSYDFIGYESDMFHPCIKTIEVFHHIIFS